MEKIGFLHSSCTAQAGAGASASGAGDPNTHRPGAHTGALQFHRTGLLARNNFRVARHPGGISVDNPNDLIDEPLAHYGFTPAALMIRCALSLSFRTKCANSGCVMPIGSPPCLATHSRRSGPASTRPMSIASLSTTPAGVPAGTHIPYQIGKSNPATPASAIVGTSGNRTERRAVLTPSAMSLPSRIWGRASSMGA